MALPLNSTVIDTRHVRDLSGLLLDSQGRLKVVPASVLAGTSANERAVFGVRNGLYGYLTHELVDFLQQRIAGRRALEIGAGHGQLAQALGIPATDNHQQERPNIRAYYEALGQTVVPYGENVQRMDAHTAVARYKPQVVVASWVTHRYDPARHEAGGNEDGVREEDILDACEAYLFVGNEKVHASKSLWSRPHQIWRPSWLYSRAVNGSPDFIALWENPTARSQTG